MRGCKSECLDARSAMPTSRGTHAAQIISTHFESANDNKQRSPWSPNAPSRRHTVPHAWLPTHDVAGRHTVVGVRGEEVRGPHSGSGAQSARSASGDTPWAPPPHPADTRCYTCGCPLVTSRGATLSWASAARKYGGRTRAQADSQTAQQAETPPGPHRPIPQAHRPARLAAHS